MIGCEGYRAIARVYDKLNAEIDYRAWADRIEAAFDRFLPARPELVLDLACGTGRMTRELSRRGYDMIGVDGSGEMLSEAYARAGDEKMPLYLCQDMRSFELYGTVGAVISCLDSVNYLLAEEDLTACFAGVHNYLDPDGLFFFDVNSPEKFRRVYANNAYILEDELDGADVYCGWQNEFDEKTGICDFYLSLFEEQADGGYRRSDEHQRERCYPFETLKKLLDVTGFEFLGVFGDKSFDPPEPDAERWYFAARCKKP